MDALKKIFPLSFKYDKDIGSLIIGIIIYLVLGVIAGAIITLATFLTAWIPVVGGILGIVLGLLSSLFGLWNFVGIIVLILAFCKILK